MSDIGELRIVVSVLNEASAELKKLDTDLNAVRAQTRNLQAESVKTSKSTVDLAQKFNELALAARKNSVEAQRMSAEFAKLKPIEQAASFGTFARVLKSEITENVKNAGQEIGVKFPEQIKKSESAIDSFLGKMTHFRWALVNAFLVINLGGMVWSRLIEPAVKYEMTIARIAAVTQTSSGASLEAINRLQQGTIYSLDQIAEAYLDVTKRGFDKAESDKIMATSTKLATFSQVELSSATDVVTMVLNQFNMTAERAAEVADKLTYADINSAASMDTIAEAMKYAGPTAYAAGVGFEELLSTIAMLSDAGIRGEMAGTAIRGILAAVTNESPKAREQMERLGVAIYDSNGDFVGLNDVFTQLAISLGQGDMSTKLEAMGDIFERRVATSVALATEKILLNNGAISDMTKGIEGASGTLDKFSISMSGSAKNIQVHHEEIGSFLRDVGRWSVVAYSALLDLADLVNPFWWIPELMKDTEKAYQMVTDLFKAPMESGVSGTNIKNNQDLFVTQTAIDIANRKSTDSLKSLVDWTEKGNPSLITRIKAINEEADAQKELITSTFESIDVRIRDNLVYQQQLKLLESVTNAKISIVNIDDQLVTEQQNLKDINEKWNDTLKDNANQLRDVRSSLEDFGRAASDAQKNISTLSTQRFTGETVILGLLDKVDIWMKKQKLLELGIADAGAFIQSQLSRVGDSFDDLIAQQETVIENSEDSANAYDAWKTTIETAIKAEVSAGESLNADVTDRVKTWQTALLGINNLNMGGGNTSTQSQFVNKLQLAYDVYYGDMHNNVKGFMMEEEDKTNQITVNSSQVVELLKTEMAAYASAAAEVAKLRTEEATLEQERREYEDKKAIQVDKKEKDINKLEDKKTIAEGVIDNAVIQNTGVNYTTPAGPGVVNSVPFYNPFDMNNFQAANEIANRKETQPGFQIMGPTDFLKNMGTNVMDTIVPNFIRSFFGFAEGGIVNGPTRAMIGEKGPEAVIPLSKLGKMGNNINVTVNVSGSNVSANEIARQIRKELQSY